MAPRWEEAWALERVTEDNQLLTTQEAKEHIRIDPDVSEDAQVDAFIQAATDEAQIYLGRQLLTANFKLHLHKFPDQDDIPIRVPRPPLTTVNSITYTDVDGTSQTWGSSEYQVDDKREPGQILPGVNASWPSAQEEKVNAVTIDFDAGYGTKSEVPQIIKNAVLLMVEYLYDNRMGVTMGQGYAAQVPIPNAARFLLDRYKIPRVG